MRLLLTGANGQLGLSIAQLILGSHGIELISADKADLDISDRTAVNAFIDINRPDIIINCAAYTQVDNAEHQQQLAHSINAKGAENLALAALKANIPLIHISTDYVFDGRIYTPENNASQSQLKLEPYTEYVKPAPLNVYGESKWRGDQSIRNVLSQHIIIRTSWLISEYGHNFAKTMIRLAQNRSELNIVGDQIGCPTYAGDLAKAILVIATQILHGKIKWGTFHYCGDVETSWYGLAKAVLIEAQAQGKLVKLPILNSIDTIDYPLPAVRPHYSVLNCQKINAVFGINSCDWQASIKTLITNLDVDSL